MNSCNPKDDQTPPKSVSLGIFIARAAAFYAWEYCISDDDLFCIKALKASFFDRITYLTSWFLQGVILSRTDTILNRFFSQLSAGDEVVLSLSQNLKIRKLNLVIFGA